MTKEKYLIGFESYQWERPQAVVVVSTDVFAAKKAAQETLKKAVKSKIINCSEIELRRVLETCFLLVPSDVPDNFTRVEFDEVIQ